MPIWLVIPFLVLIGGVVIFVIILGCLEHHVGHETFEWVAALGFLLLLVLIVISGIGVFHWEKRELERKAFQNMLQSDTIDSCLAFLDQYSEGNLAGDARVRLLHLLQARRAIYVDAIQDYGNAENTYLPFLEDIAKFAEALDMESLHIRVVVNGRALGANYTRRGFLYPGATGSGHVLIEEVGNQKIIREFPFGAKMEPLGWFALSELHAGPQSPSNAPFWIVHDAWLRSYAKVLGEVYGADRLVRALDYCSAPPRLDPWDDRSDIIRWRESFSISLNAAKVLAELYKDPRAIGVLIKSADAAHELACIGRPAVRPLIVALQDSSSDVRAEAAKALGMIGDSLAVNPLISALGDDFGVRKNAARALGDIGDSRAVEHLIRLLRDDRSFGDDVRRNAASSLTRITGHDFGTDSIVWRKWWEMNRR